MTPAVTYLPKRTYPVNKIGNNYLVRGNEPLNSDGTFAYEALSARLNTLLGINLSEFNLIDISVIDNIGERTDLSCEFLAYGFTMPQFDTTFPQSIWPPFLHSLNLQTQYGTCVLDSTGQTHPGSIIWYPVQGCNAPGTGGSCADVEPTQYNFIGMIDFIQDLCLNTKTASVIYYHCENGHDRTGAISAAYMMKYMGVSYSVATTERPAKGAKAFTHPWNPPYECLINYYYETIIKKLRK